MSDDGFTLWECLCVLLVISIFGLLPVIKIEKWKNNQHAMEQLVMFERLYEKSQHSAIIEEESSEVVANKKTQTLHFSYSYKGQTQEEKIVIEKPLTIERPSMVELQAGTASPSKLETFSFIDESTNTKIRYVVQLGSSKVFKYVEKE